MKCKNCGNNCPPRAKFCPTCGKEIRSQGTKSKSRTTGYIFIIWLITVCILGFFAVLIPYPSNIGILVILVLILIIGGLCIGALVEDMMTRK
ncbi:MAG: hypothetical protein ACFFHV_16810 [Promethearchaeota archaeon]